MMYDFRLTVLLSALVLLAGVACSSGADRLPCPAAGLARQGTEEEINDQLLNWQNYDCKEAQICPDLPARRESFQIVGQVPAQMSFLLTNCSTGREILEVSKVVIYGDSNCSFSEAELDNNPAIPREGIFLRVLYDPQQEGQDHALIGIFSNAENFPELRLPICGQAFELNGGAPAPDGGTVDASAGDGFQCVAVADEVNTACHQP